MKRKRTVYLVFVIFVIILGIASRKYGEYLPEIISEYSGDILWALMVYLGLGFTFNRNSIKNVSISALVFSYAIEISQLYQAQWINRVRDTTVGSLILGHGFLYSDLICYTIGILFGVIFEYIYYSSGSKEF